MAGLEGRTLDRYELQRLLGRGGMADVYVAFDPHFDREVALKIFKREDEDLLRRFVREAKLMASLSNSHLMPVYDAGTARLDESTVYYIVMPLMTGGTLRTRVRHARLPLQTACRYIREIADALDYIHGQGIVHRDIKSSNVLLDAEDHCYLADFGIARTTTDQTQMTSTGNVLGTVDYIAPELFETDQRANSLSDLYSLGVLLYEMVTGHLPFTGDSQIAVVTMHVGKQPPSPRTFVPELSSAVERVLLKGLEKRPALRYQSGTEMAEAFCLAVNNPAEFLSREAMSEQSTRVVREPAPGTPAAFDYDAPLTQAPTYVRPSPRPTRPIESVYAGTSYSTLPPQSSPAVPLPPGYGTSAYNQMSSPYNRSARTPEQKRGLITVILALITLAVLATPIAYVVIAHPFTSNPAPQPTSVSTVPTPDLTATAQAQGATATATAVQQAKNATATAQANANATASAQANAANAATATAQARANATATAQANATATAQANATATAAVIQTATAGNPIYTDNLQSAQAPDTQAAQWDGVPGHEKDGCAFMDDGYHVSAKTGLGGAATLVGCHESQKQFANFALRVDAVIASGHSGGVFFHLATDILGNYKGYLFEFDTNGNYKISRSNNFSSGSTVIQDWTPSAALKTGNGAKNTLQLIARGGTLLFYVNDAFLTTQQDTNYKSGTIGLLATTSSNGADAEVIYSNLSVYPQS